MSASWSLYGLPYYEVPQIISHRIKHVLQNVGRLIFHVEPVSTPILYCGDAKDNGIYNTSSILVEADDGLCDEIDTWSFAHLFIIYQLIPVALLAIQRDWNGIVGAAVFAILLDLLGTRGLMKLRAPLSIPPTTFSSMDSCVACHCCRRTFISG